MRHPCDEEREGVVSNDSRGTSATPLVRYPLVEEASNLLRDGVGLLLRLRSIEVVCLD